jgi:outer membrane protein OmpA-like peptidoglycan-associated protein
MGTVGCKASVKINQPEPEPVAEPAPPPPAPEPIAAEPVPEDPSDVHLEGDHIVIDKKIHFATDSDVIQEDSFELLDHIATLLKNHEEISTLHIIGHTDKTGSAAHNKDLSQRRAAAVVKALEERGVTQTMDSRGAGPDEPVCEETTAECNEKNRRVEFKVEMAEKDA